MIQGNEERGIILQCDRDGTITDVVRQEERGSPAFEEGRKWTNCLNEDSVARGDRFFESVLQEAGIEHCELNVSDENELITYRFAGIVSGETVTVLASQSHAGLADLVRELCVGNEFLPAGAPAGAPAGSDDDPSSLNRHVARELRDYDEISRLNNELVNLHRTVAKNHAELARLNEMRNRFLGIAAHDLRNPLGKVRMLADLVEADVPHAGEAHHDYLEQIRALSTSMLRLVEDILDVSALEAGEVRLRLEKLDLVEVIGRVVRLHEGQARAGGFDLGLDLPDRDAPLYVDRGKLDQVLNNLITNAMKYSSPGTRIEVRLDIDEAWYRISVADSGIGMSPEGAAKLFQPFQTLEKKAVDGEKSTGLGLYIARRIVEAHAGTIDVESEVGSGSVFTVSLPRDQKRFPPRGGLSA